MFQEKNSFYTLIFFYFFIIIFFLFAAELPLTLRFSSGDKKQQHGLKLPLNREYEFLFKWLLLRHVTQMYFNDAGGDRKEVRLFNGFNSLR